MGKVVAFDVERKRRRSEEPARVRGNRKIIQRDWLSGAVEAAIQSGLLIDGDLRVARSLTCFPSATFEGRVWPGQMRLSGSLARSRNTINRSIARFVAAGLLGSERRGRGRTNRYTLCIEGRPIIGVSDADDAPLDAPRMVNQAAPSVVHQKTDDAPRMVQESCLTTPESFELESSPNPLTTTTPIREPDEVLSPSSSITFQEFWNASRINSATNDKIGPARSTWQKLDDVDRDQIAWAIQRDGGAVDLQQQWTVTWLKQRCWEERGPLARSGDDFIADVVDGLRAKRNSRLVSCRPGDPVFEREYARRVAAGESVDDMHWAISRGAKTFTMRLANDGGGG